MLLLIIFIVVFASSMQYSSATEYLLVILAADEHGFGGEVGECTTTRARFGRSESSDEVLSGCFVAASPANACSPLVPAPAWNTSVQCIGGFYAVAARGNCSFSQKAYNAQAANYQGLIVYNSVSQNFPVPMDPDEQFAGRTISIPAFMIGYDCGSMIIRLYTYGQGFGFVIRTYWSYHDLLRYLVPFVVVVGVCFVVMLAAMVVRCIGEHRRQMRRRLTKRHLKQIPTKKFVKGEDPETCPICLDDFEDSDKLRILPCGHAYHCRCIDPWLLKTRRVCPICKRKVLIGGRDDSSDSETEHTSGGGGRSGSVAVMERTPLLADQDGIRASSSGFYGIHEGSQTAMTVPSRIRPIQLSPASTPGDDVSYLPCSTGATQHPLTQLARHADAAHANPDRTNSSVQTSSSYSNPNFADEPSSPAAVSNRLTINADFAPEGRNV